MPLLEVVQTKHVSASIRLSESTAIQLNQYAHLIGASADSVIEEALKHCFAKDREFQDFIKTPEAKQVAASLRIRKAAASEAPEILPKKPAIAGQPTAQTSAVAAGSKA